MNPPDASKSRDYSEWRTVRMCSMRPWITKSRLARAAGLAIRRRKQPPPDWRSYEHERFARTDRSRAVIVRSHRVRAGAGASALRPGDQSRNCEESCCGCRRGGKEEQLEHGD